MGAADKLTLHRKYKVSSADADMYKRLRPGAMINFIIQAAIDSADELGFGFADIETRQLFWVLSRMTVEIYKHLCGTTKSTLRHGPKTVKDFCISAI